MNRIRITNGFILGLLGVAVWFNLGLTQPAPSKEVQPEKNGRVITCNFDEVDASSKPVGGEALVKYFATHGITLSDLTPGSKVEIMDVRTLYGGKAAKASSGSNILTQVGSNKGVAFTLRFKQPMEKVVFTRVGLIPSESGVTHPFWRAVALDAEGKTVDRVLEWLIASYKEVRAATYTLAGPAIVAVRFESDAVDFAAFSGVLIDDVTLYPVGFATADPVTDYLTPAGQLKHKLVLRDTGGFAGRGTGRRWEVEPDGAWLRIAVEKGSFAETRGQLSKEQLAFLAKELARHGMLGLPKQVNKMTIADGFNVMIEFGDMRSVFFGKGGFRDLPKPDGKTDVGRFAAIVRVIQGNLPPFDPGKEPTIEQLRVAPEHHPVFGEAKLTLSTYLWRDFMPIAPPDGKPLRASIKLQRSDGKPIPGYMTFMRLWVINGNDVWAPKNGIAIKKSGSAWEISVGDGPKWEPGSEVDVVMQVHAGRDLSFLLRAANQKIHRTD